MRDRVTDTTTDEQVAAKTPTPRRSEGLSPLLDLQRTAGNAAVVAMLDGPELPVVQAKLQVGAVDDPAEAEADRIADQVLRHLAANPVQRREDAEVRRAPNEQAIYQATLEEEVETDESEADEHQTAPESASQAESESGESEADESDTEDAQELAPQTSVPQSEVESAETESDESDQVHRVARRFRRISRKADASAAPGHGFEGGAVENDVARQIESARGGGAPLEPAMRSRMEEGFGADFSGIRVHTGSQAAELNRSLNAQAFTTGSDIFLGSSGVSERIMAHELAHTVQQGAATAQRMPVRRFMAIADFEALTYESTFSMKSTAQNEIIKLLRQYSVIAPFPKKPGERPKVPPDKVEAARTLVEGMRTAAHAYIEAKKQDPKAKSKRLAGFRSFYIDCGLELDRLQHLQDTEQDYKDKKDQQDKNVKLDTTGVNKVVGHYSGTLSSAMEKAALGVNQLASANGDSGEMEIELDVPVSPGVTIGAHFAFEAKRGGKPKDPKPGPVEVGCELGFKVGGDALFAKIQAGLGGYFKAQGKDASSAMKLVSYGLYRRCRESSVIPSEIANKLWGGDTSEKGKKKAEDWSLLVESQEFGDDDSYVETGGYAAIGAKGEAGIAEIEGEIKGTMGKRHDKKSLDNSAKGGAGKQNTKGDNWFAQKTTGRNVKGLELSAKASLIEAFGLELKLEFNWRESGKKGDPSKLEEFEIKARGHGSLPAGGFEEKLSNLIISFSKQLKQLQQGQLQKAATTSQVGAGASTAWGIADTTVTGVEGAPTTDVVKKAIGMGAKEGAKEGGKSLIESASKVGLELAYTFKWEDGACYSQFEILHRKSLDAKIPSLLEAQLVRRQRLLVGSNEGGSWTWDLLA